MSKKIKISSNKSFGYVFFVFFLIVSFYPIINGESLRYWALAIAFIFLLLGIINSKILTPLNKLWFYFGIVLGKIVSPIVMAIIFFGVVTPIGLLMRILGKDLIRLKENSKKTNWIEKSGYKSNMKNQF